MSDCFIDRRLKVTVSGPRGAGKTNLTLAITRMLSGYADQGLRGKVEAAEGDRDARVVIENLSRGLKVETSEPITVILANEIEDVAPRKIKTVAQLIETLQRFPEKMPLLNDRCEALSVVPRDGELIFC